MSYRDDSYRIGWSPKRGQFFVNLPPGTDGFEEVKKAIKTIQEANWDKKMCRWYFPEEEWEALIELVKWQKIPFRSDFLTKIRTLKRAKMTGR